MVLERHPGRERAQRCNIADDLISGGRTTVQADTPIECLVDGRLALRLR